MNRMLRVSLDIFVTSVVPIAQLVSMSYQLVYTKIMWIHKENKLRKLQNCHKKLEYN